LVGTNALAYFGSIPGDKDVAEAGLADGAITDDHHFDLESWFYKAFYSRNLLMDATTLSIMTFSIMTLTKNSLHVTPSINDTQHK
jgi:hypothetical protein